MKNKNHLIVFFVLILISTIQINSSKAQTIKVLGGNTLNGAVNGAMLGGATMAIQNSNDFAPLRVGLGAGTLYGLTVGIYDISQMSKGQQYYVSGTFNDGDNSTILVLLDTFYGGAAGALVATSFNLISDQPVEEGLQYGAGIGAWTGFGFGLIDSFILAERAGDFESAAYHSNKGPAGMLSIVDQNMGYSLNFINPELFHQPYIENEDITLRSIMTLNLINLRIQI